MYPSTRTSLQHLWVLGSLQAQWSQSWQKPENHQEQGCRRHQLSCSARFVRTCHVPSRHTKVWCTSVMFKSSLCFCKFQKRERRRNVLCTFNSSQALLSPSDLFILCLWSLLVKADPNDVGVGQRKASWTGLHCDSQSGVGFPKGTFQLCFHTKDYWSTLFETWMSGRSNLIWWK